nr:IclR family transcriptional regulator [Kineococcus aurantiacus]
MRSLERAIDVLEVLDSSRRPLRLTDIARRAGLPVATTQRILTVLEARGRVERDGHEYRPGVALLLGAHAYLTSSPLLTAARPVLHDLAASTGLTSSLFKRLGASRLVLARVQGTTPLRYELPIGERLPLHVGAGKVLLAHMDPEQRRALLSPAPGAGAPADPAVDPVVDHEQFDAQMDAIRAAGFSQARGEREPGMASVAVAVLVDGSSTECAVQVAGRQEELPVERVPALSVEVRRAARAIAQQLP